MLTPKSKLTLQRTGSFMKHKLFVICLFSLFNLHTSFAMDTAESDPEGGTPLEIICKPKKLVSAIPPKTPQLTIEQQFEDFEEKIRITYFGDKRAKTFLGTPIILTPDIYLKQAEKNIPQIITNKALIDQLQKKYTLSFLIQVIKLNLKDAEKHYAKTSGETLKNIMNPHASIEAISLKSLPPILQKYIMKQAYKNIEKNCPCKKKKDNKYHRSIQPFCSKGSWKHCSNFVLCS